MPVNEQGEDEFSTQFDKILFESDEIDEFLNEIKLNTSSFSEISFLASIEQNRVTKIMI